MPPPGARRLSAAPDAGQGVLQRPLLTPQTPDLVVDLPTVPAVPTSRVPAVLTSRDLFVQVVSAGHGKTAIRAESQVIWLPAKPAAERVPSAAESVTVTALSPDYLPHDWREADARIGRRGVLGAAGALGRGPALAAT